MKRYIILAVTAVLCWSAASAQQDVLPSRSLTIEGAYNPTMTSSEKIMPVPERPVTEHKAVQVSYLTDPKPVSTLSRNPMGAFSESSDDVERSSYEGLVRFGYGLRNVHDGLLDFSWHISDRDELKVSGLMDAWATKPVADWKSRMFNGDIKAAYCHSFDRFTVGVDGAFGHSHYNYRPGVSLDSAKMELSSLMQKVGRGQVGLSVYGESTDVKWHLRTGMEWLSRNGLDLAGSTKDNRERLLRIEGGLSMPVLDGTGGLEYRQKSAAYDWEGLYGADYSNFTTITLHPYWKYSWGRLDANLGLNVDARTRAGYKFLLSPMVTATYNISDGFKLKAGATGGLEDNSMRTLARVSPYWSETERIKDGYTLSDIWLGASYSQGTWLSLSGKAGYRHTIDELFQTSDDSLIVTSMLKQEGVDVFYVSLDADMLFADRAQIKMDMTWNGYTGKYSEGLLALKPVIDASVFGKVNIVPGLDAMLTYRMLAFRKIDGARMPMVNDVALTFDYDFRPNLSFYLTGNRLAGGEYYYYAGYRSIKPSVMIGATYRF